MVSRFLVTQEAGEPDKVSQKVGWLRDEMGLTGKVVYRGDQLVLSLTIDAPDERTARDRGYQALHDLTDAAGLRIMLEIHHDGPPDFEEHWALPSD